jgi:hypothetical protein
MRDKIRILFLSASPVDKGALRLGAEVRAVQEKIAVAPARDMFELIQYHALRPDDLQRVLLKHQPHIVHFSGHGSLAEEILLEDPSGHSRPLTGAAIAQLFSFFKDQVRIVFFDACFSTPQAKAISRVIDYTLGTSKAIGAKSAIVFAGSFYLALAFRRTVTEAFELAKTELAFTRVPIATLPVLLIRDGVDREETFLALSEDTDHQLVRRVRKALLHLTSRQANAVKTNDSAATTEKETTRAGAPDDSRIGEAAKDDTRWRDTENEEGLRVGTKEDVRATDTDETGGSRERPSGVDQSASASVSEDEKILIRRELINGTLIIEHIEGAAETESDVMAALSDVTHRLIHLGVGEAAYRRIQEQLYPSPPGLPPPLPGLMFVGREDSLTDIKNLLGIGQPAPQTGNVTVVRGWPGVGKTALVEVLARDPEIAGAFPDGVLWTTLDQTPELMSKIAQWGRCLGTEDLLRVPTLEEATERLGRLLHHRRMLLIVDDVWNAAHALPFVRAAVDSKCALLATTRLTSVADALAKLDTSKNPEGGVYILPVLTEENALILLRYLAPAVVEEHFDECLELVRDLECLPLALHVAGRLLKEEANMGLDVNDLITRIRTDAKLLDELAPPDQVEGATIPTVGALFRQSTDLLDDLTRECFASLGVFAPKPATFDLGALKAVWMVDDPKPIIRKLVGQGLLEPIGTERFQIHALLVQHALSLLS